MKYYILAVAITLGLYACGSNTTEITDTNHSESQEHNHAQNAGDVDPICGMEKDDNWTLYSTHGVDTIWFCSEYCKTAFDANPHKYLGEHTH